MSSNEIVAPPAGRSSTAVVDKRLRTAVYGVAVSFLSIYLWNAVVSVIDFAKREWTFPVTLSLYKPVGIDFRMGIYEPAALLLRGKSPYSILNYYTPFMAVLGTPFTLVSVETAYRLQIGLLIAMNIAAIHLAVTLTASVFPPPASTPRSAFVLLMTVLIGAFHFTSYGFLFSIERGNYDIYPAVLSLAVVWLLLNRPSAMWPAVLLLSIATQMKLYPAILFALVLWRHGWRCVLPAIAVNAALLLILGYDASLQFFDGLRHASQDNHSWMVNHSARAFADLALLETKWFSGAGVVLSAVPIAIWFGGMTVLYRRGWNSANALLAFALTDGVVNVALRVSCDYRLVITTVPIIVLVCGCVARYSLSGSWRPLVTLAALMMAAHVIAGSYAQYTSIWFANKCPAVLFVQFLVLLAILVRGIVLPQRRPAPDRHTVRS